MRYLSIICGICHKEFNGQITGSHLKTHNINTKEYEKLFGPSKDPKLLESCKSSGVLGGGNSGAREASRRKKEERIRLYTEHPRKCLECNKALSYHKKISENRFCNRQCFGLYSNKKRFPVETRQPSKSPKIKRPVRFCCSCIKKIWTYSKSGYCRDCYIHTEMAMAQRGRTFSKTRIYKTNPQTEEVFYLMSKVEEFFFDTCIRLQIRVEKPKPIPYTDASGKSHVYFPDFLLPEHECVIETKGFLTREDKEKLRNVKDQNPKRKIEILFRKDIESFLKKLVG